MADKVGEKVVECVVFGVLALMATWAVAARHWIAGEWACIRRPVCEVQGWSLGLLILSLVAAKCAAVVLAVLFFRLRRKWNKQQKALSDMLGQPPQPPFKPITVEDDRLKLRWFIRKSPDGWLHWRKIETTVSPDFMRETLDGPFHAVPGCNGPLAENWLYTSDGSSRQPIFTGQCQTCGVKIFQGLTIDGRKSGHVTVWPVCVLALEELQRMHRNGTVFDGKPITLEKPTYWKVMVPPEDGAAR